MFQYRGDRSPWHRDLREVAEAIHPGAENDKDAVSSLANLKDTVGTLPDIVQISAGNVISGLQKMISATCNPPEGDQAKSDVSHALHSWHRSNWLVATDVNPYTYNPGRAASSLVDMKDQCKLLAEYDQQAGPEEVTSAHESLVFDTFRLMSQFHSISFDPSRVAQWTSATGEKFRADKDYKDKESMRMSLDYFVNNTAFQSPDKHYKESLKNLDSGLSAAKARRDKAETSLLDVERLVFPSYFAGVKSEDD